MLCPLCPGSLGRPWAKFLYPDYGLAHVLGIQPRSCAFGSIQAIGNQLPLRLNVCVLSTHICNSLPEFMLFITFWRGRSFQWRRISFDLDQSQEVKGKVGIPFVGWFRRTTKKTTHVWWFRRACLYPFSAKHNEGRPRSGPQRTCLRQRMRRSPARRPSSPGRAPASETCEASRRVLRARALAARER